MKIAIACNSGFNSTENITQTLNTLLDGHTEPVTLITGFDEHSDRLAQNVAKNAKYGVLRASGSTPNLCDSAIAIQSDYVAIFTGPNKDTAARISHLCECAISSGAKLIFYVPDAHAVIPKTESRLIQFAFSDEDDNLLFYQIFVIIEVNPEMIGIDTFQEDVETILIEECERSQGSYEEIVENALNRYDPSLKWQAFQGTVQNARLTNAFFV